MFKVLLQKRNVAVIYFLFPR